MKRCVRNLLKMAQFQVSPYPKEEAPAPSWQAGAARDGGDNGNGSIGGGWKDPGRWPGRKDGNLGPTIQGVILC